MAVRGFVSVPRVVLAIARYAPAIVTPGTLRQPGIGMTGADLQLLYVLLDAAEGADGKNTVLVPQTRISALLEREHPKRIGAALDRLRGTDMMIGNMVPCAIEWGHVGIGLGQMAWRVRLDRSVVELVRASITGAQRTEIMAGDIAGLSSRYSLVLYSRYRGLVAGDYPGREIGLGKVDGKRGFRLEIPVGELPSFFGYYMPLRQSEIRKFLVTSSPTCPLDRELRRSAVAVDVVPRLDAITGAITDLTVLLSATTHKGIEMVRASQRHARIQSDVAKAGRAAEKAKAAI